MSGCMLILRRFCAGAGAGAAVLRLAELEGWRGRLAAWASCAGETSNCGVGIA